MDKEKEKTVELSENEAKVVEEEKMEAVEAEGASKGSDEPAVEVDTAEEMKTEEAEQASYITEEQFAEIKASNEQLTARLQAAEERLAKVLEALPEAPEAKVEDVAKVSSKFDIKEYIKM